MTLKSLTDHSRLFDATVTAALLPSLGVPVFQEGFLLHLPNMTLEVADVCSSIPGIAALLALGAAYGIVMRRSRGVRAILVLAAVPLGIVSNIVRILVTAAGVYYLGPTAVNNVVHQWNGATVFLVTWGGLLLLDTALQRPSKRPVSIIDWYQLGATTIAGEYELCLRLFLHTLVGRRQGLVLVRLATDGSERPEGLVRAFGPWLRSSFVPSKGCTDTARRTRRPSPRGAAWRW